jgi:protein O-GlcNAc transferase
MGRRFGGIKRFAKVFASQNGAIRPDGRRAIRPQYGIDLPRHLAAILQQRGDRSMTQTADDKVFRQAVQHHQAGQLDDAEKLYRQILSQNPRHAASLHMLGVVAVQREQYETAAELIGRSISLAPNVPEAHGNLGVAYERLGRTDQAIACFRRALAMQPKNPVGHFKLAGALHNAGQTKLAMEEFKKAIELRPDYAEAHVNLGNALNAGGQFGEAIRCYERALELNPKFPEALSNMGNALQGLKKMDEALDCYRKALEIKPDYGEAMANMGVAFQARGQIDEAMDWHRKALALNPNYAEGYNNLANCLQLKGEIAQAVELYQKALELKPDYVEAHSNLGNAYQEQEKYDAAVFCYRKALALNPDLVGAINNLGNALQALGRFDESVIWYKKAIQHDPEHFEALASLGNVLQTLGKPEESLEHTKKALAIQPGQVDAYNNMGNAAKDMGLLEEAIRCYRKSVELEPTYYQVHSNAIFTMQFLPDVDPRELLKETIKWDEMQGKRVRGELLPFPNERNPDRRLRIGYVSPDFRNHCQSFFTEPLFSHHDHEQFEIYLYSSVPQPDSVTEKLRNFADVWRSAVAKRDEDVAQMIREDRIDILIDLTMHMAHNRELLFARKPAPIQAAWLAYPGTTGLSTMDYRISDPFLDPPGLNDEYYSEKTLRLPDSFWCYNPLSDEPAVSELPALKNGYITFGCLNNFCKIHEALLKTWKRVLDAVPTSRLLLLVPTGSPRQRVLDQLHIDAARVEFVPFQNRTDYLKTYHRIDLGLDTFPVNGHTTSLDSLWMGVPVVTYYGQSAMSRAGLSQTTNLGIASEFLGHSADEFVNLAVKACGDLPRLAELRSTLRSRMQKSVLMDGAKFARGMEALYRQIWRAWCSGN